MRLRTVFEGRKLGHRMLVISVAFTIGIAATLAASWYAHRTAAAAGTAINVAGRQRMLNQRHTKEVFGVAYTPRTQIESTRQTLLTSAAALMHGGTTTQGTVPGTADAELQILLNEQVTALQRTFTAADVWMQNPQDAQSAESLLAATDMAHVAAQKCVQRIQDIASRNSAALLQREIAIAVATGAICCLLTMVICSGFVGEVKVSAFGLRHLARKELKGVTSVMKQNADETTQQATAASSITDQVNASTEALATAVEEVRSSISEISVNASAAADVGKQAVEAATDSNNTVAKLGQSSDEIGDVVRMISSIAEQTNLLALNATIEAARAGDAGKGFAVVANEVKELAKQTSTATEDITRRITTIQNDATQVGASLERVGRVIGEINASQNAIASSVEEQSAMTAQISRNIEEVSSGSREIAASIHAVAEAAVSTTAATVQTLVKADAIEATAAGLLSLVTDRASGEPAIMPA